MKRKILANTYGSAFPLKQEFDRKILSRYLSVCFRFCFRVMIYVDLCFCYLLHFYFRIEEN